MAAPTIAVSESTGGRSRWIVVGLLTLGVIIAYTSRVNLSAALPEIRKSVPLTLASIGLLLSAFFWAYTLLQIPAGWIIDRFGIRWPYAAAMLFWSILSAATALANTLGALILVRVLLGIGEAFVTPASIGYIRKHFPEHKRGLPVGIFMSGTKYGTAIGAPAATYLVLGYGWKWMFLICGAISLPLLALWLVLVGKEDDFRAAGKRDAGVSTSWVALLRAPVMLGTCLGTFCYMYFVYFCMTWMPIFFHERYGLSLMASGWFTFASFGGMATVAIVSGAIADFFISRGHNPVTVRRLFTIAGFILGCTELFGALSGTSSMTLFWAVFSLCGLGLATANYWALSQTLTPANTAAQVAGIQNTAANLAGIAAPWITGILVEKTKHFEAPIIAIGIWLAIGVCCYVFLVQEKYALVEF